MDIVADRVIRLTHKMNFEKFFKVIKSEPVFNEMRVCRENSPYHREESVFEHTMMVCDEFDNRYSTLDDDYFVGLFACLFHDVGKPACRIKKENEKRGVYFSYDGHDLKSAEIAEDIMVRHGFSEFDVARVCWMIRHHQTFWCVKDNDKKVEVANVFRNSGFGLDFHCFRAFMLADDFGRIMDERTVDSVAYFDEFKRQYLN